MNEANKAAKHLLGLQGLIRPEPCRLCGGPTLMDGIHGHSAACPNLGREQAARDLAAINAGRFVSAQIHEVVVRR